MKENFSTQIKKSNTDEWYTPVEPVEGIVPYLNRGGVQENTLSIR
jgi:hypothetical protein